jgi:hypothetical protein
MRKHYGKRITGRRLIIVDDRILRRRGRRILRIHGRRDEGKRDQESAGEDRRLS